MNNKKKFDTPVLFIIFNRPETTKKVFEAIRKYKPSKLFVAADGPREGKLGEQERCEEARKITEQIDWPCEVKRLYRKKNLGCKLAVSGAITWFFENVEEGIILEDDCLPNPSFFTFCEQMLELYRNDKKVMCISGDNFLPTQMQKGNGYYFSKYIHIWGWATWRRAWKNYDVNIKDWPEVKKKGIINKYFDSFLEKTYWQTLFGAVYRGKINTWDYQFVYHVWRNSGFSVAVGVNLVKNVGFTKGATHLNTNPRLLLDNDVEIVKEPKPLGRKFSDLAERYTKEHIFRISLLGAIKQFIYYYVINGS